MQSQPGEFYNSHEPKPLSEAGRVCKHPDCEAVLSRYNAADRCSLHRRVMVVPEGATKPQKRRQRR